MYDVLKYYSGEECNSLGTASTKHSIVVSLMN